MIHLKALNKIRQSLESDDNALALILFGSVATGKYHQKSDIDLMIIYQEFSPWYEFTTDFVDNIKVGFSRWSLEKWQESLINQPYRKYVFTTAKILFDKTGKAYLWQEKIIDYFKENSDVREVWNQYKADYEIEKQKYGSGQTNIFDIYQTLDKKFHNRTLKT